MRRLVVVLCITGSGWLAGCGALVERAGVVRDFRETFACQARTVSRVGAGFVVEGCGRRARYVCVDVHDEWHHHSFEVGHGKLVTSLLGAAIEESMRADRCLLAYTEHFDAAPRLVSGLPAAVARRQTNAGVPQLKARSVFAGGSFRLQAKPTLHPDHVLLSVRGLRRLNEGPCQAQLFHDGVPVPVQAVQRANAFEAHLLLRAESLRDVDRAARFAGSVCGFEFEFDETARKTVGAFETRLREERARLEVQVARAPAAH